MSNQNIPKAEIPVTHSCLLKIEAKHSFNFPFIRRLSLIFTTTFIFSGPISSLIFYLSCLWIMDNKEHLQDGRKEIRYICIHPIPLPKFISFFLHDIIKPPLSFTSSANVISACLIFALKPLVIWNSICMKIDIAQSRIPIHSIQFF